MPGNVDALASLLREFLADGCVVVASPRSGPAEGAVAEGAALVAVTSIQLDGDVVVRITEEVLLRPELWDLHLERVKRRLAPLLDLELRARRLRRLADLGSALLGLSGTALGLWRAVRPVLQGAHGIRWALGLGRGWEPLALRAVLLAAAVALLIFRRRLVERLVGALLRRELASHAGAASVLGRLGSFSGRPGVSG